MIKGGGGGGSQGGLDFFGSKEGAPQGSAERGGLLQEDGAGEKGEEVPGKRKRTAENGRGKRKRKKMQGICVHIHAVACLDRVCASCSSLL